NHITGEEMAESRNMLVEAARLTRGAIKPLAELKADDYHAVIIPGGFGAAKNLSDFALKGRDLAVREDVRVAVQGFRKAQKPVGLMCIAPAMVGILFGYGAKFTIGNDPETAAAVEATGAEHVECSVHDIVVDEDHKLVTTPAYMLAGTISEAASGISRLVDKVIELTNSA
ncbi:MAG: isoprenoid biosynthesis glyoxalase ElbB, partial [Desulfovibrionales bacterium]|nr:isoprenoid biosynthesis glyoxalase ElbB [Desulfovibrionales bacterium]